MNAQHQIQRDYTAMENLVLMNVKKSMVTERPPIENIEVMDPTHVCYIHVKDVTSDKDALQWKDGEPCSFRRPKMGYKYEQSIKLPTKYLRQVIDCMDCDTVEIIVEKDYPITIKGKCGKVKKFDVEVIIAPRIDNE